MGLPGVKARCWQGYAPSLQKRESFSLGESQIPCLSWLLEAAPIFCLGTALLGLRFCRHVSFSDSDPPSYKDIGLSRK